MECNKDEASRAKEVAEKKFLEMDIAGAKKFALKARDLYPSLDGLSELLETLEVYVSAEKRINGEIDWYAVLGVEPLADDKSIERRYRKLALALHPDKNKSVGADGAFKLIYQAWSLLSDRAKKVVYDQKRNPYARIPDRRPSVPASQNGFHDFFRTGNWNEGDNRSGHQYNPIPKSPTTLKPTFWTMCSACKTRFEYPTVYISCNLVCAHCRQPFLSFEVPAPPVYTNASSTSRTSQMQGQEFQSTRLERNFYDPGRAPASTINSSQKILGSRPFCMPGGISSVPTSTTVAAEVPVVFGLVSKHLKRAREDSTAPAMREEAHLGKIHAVKKTVGSSAFQSSCFGSNSAPEGDRPRKKRRSFECRVESERSERETGMTSHNVGLSSAGEFQKGSSDAGRVNSAGNYKRNGMRETLQFQFKNLLVEKARKEIRTKLNEWTAASLIRKFDRSKSNNTEVIEKNKRIKTGVKPGVEECHVDAETMGKKPCPADSLVSASEVADSMSMSVIDPDFHNFDADRVEKSFGKNEVWAAYDMDGGMPRYYAMIHGVVSLNPFKLKISWLNSKNNNELAQINWISSGFSKTCGVFRIGKHEFSDSLSSFSHRVKWTKGVKGAVLIYPKKGDVWALYRNWSIGWNELTPDKIIHEYDMVEVLEDYNEEQGVNVAPLVKVAGFKTVFRQHGDQRKIRNIPREEMFRFSHQVPSHLLTGQEGHNASRGCLELDPAATPDELLEVVTEAPDQVSGMTFENSSEDGLGQRESLKEVELVERSQTTEGEDSVENVSQQAVAEETRKKENRLENLIVYKRKRVKEKRVV